MAAHPIHTVVEHFCRTAGPTGTDLSDAQLLDRYVHRQDQAAFEVLVWRHGAMVVQLCRRLLRDSHEAEDAFQATFLVFARKAASIGKSEAVGPWLYQVAYRVALRAKARLARQPVPSTDLGDIPTPADDPGEAAAWQDLRPVLDQEINRLPRQYRTPFILHYLQGKTCEAVGRVIGSSKGTVSMRLSRAREMLRMQLSRRGIALSTGLLGLVEAESLAGSLSRRLVQVTVRVSRKFTMGNSTAPTSAVALAQGTLNAMTTSKWKATAFVLLAVIGFGGMGTVSYEALAGKRSENVAANEAEPLAQALDAAGKNDAPEPPANNPNFTPPARKLFQVDHHGDPLPSGALARMGKLQIAPQARVRLVAFAADGKTLVSYGQVPHRWDAFTGKEIDMAQNTSWPDPTYARLVGSLDGKAVAVSDLLGRSKEGGVAWIDLSTGKETRPLLPKGEEYVRFMAFSPDGRWFASVGGTGAYGGAKAKAPCRVRVWEVASGKEVQTFEGGGPLAFSPDSKSLAFGVLSAEDNAGMIRYEPLFASLDSDHQVIRVADLTTGKITRELREVAVKGFTHSLTFSPDGQTLAYLGFAGAGGAEELLLWDLRTGRRGRQFLGLFRDEGQAVHCLAFSPDGKTLATGGQDGKVRLWEVATGKERRSFKGHIGFVECLAFSPDGKRLASGSQDTTALVWDVTGLLTADRPLPARLSPQELDQLWDRLASQEATGAYDAIWSGVAAPTQVVALLAKQVRPVPSPAPERLAQLLAELDNPQFEVREKAERELGRLRELAAPSVETLLASKPSLEVRQRAEQLLGQLSGPITDTEVLRSLRSIEVLEAMGTADARKALETLAGGAAEARVTREARAAWERLARRPFPMP